MKNDYPVGNIDDAIGQRMPDTGSDCPTCGGICLQIHPKEPIPAIITSRVVEDDDGVTVEVLITPLAQALRNVGPRIPATRPPYPNERKPKGGA